MKRKLLLFLLSICFFLPDFAATGQYNFIRVDGGSGLSNSHVKSIIQDSYGFIWLGTRNGLNRYDGVSMKLYNCYVEAYPGDICSYTSLKEGKVQILENETEDEHILSELRPGTQLVYNVQTGQYQLNQVDIEEIGDWMRGQIVVKHKTLQELIDILKQKYEYSFELQTDSISNIVYNIVLEQESLEEILNDITVITPQVHYSINYGTRTVIIR